MTLNRENFRKLIQSTLDADPRDFTMEVYAQCGSPACVIGNYAARQDLQSEFRLDAHGRVLDVANELANYWGYKVREHFGISDQDTQDLFAAPDDSDEDEEGNVIHKPGGCGDATTPEEAVHYLTMWMVKRCAEEDGVQS